jgi:hypothetical protein
MTYIVKFTNETKPPVIIPNNTVNAQTSLSLLGKNYPGYGESVAENFLHILENFSSNDPPPNPVEGQLWYNTSFDILNVYTSSGTWKSLGTISINATNPTTGSSITPGHLWINNLNKRVFVYTGIEWLELATINEGNGVFVTVRYDSNNNTHTILEFCVNFQIILIISSDDPPWSPQCIGSTTEYIFDTGVRLCDVFPLIKNGINISNTVIEPGYTGSRGFIGFTGSRGLTGLIGSTGWVGSQGAQGPIGYTGSRGFTGSVGPAATTDAGAVGSYTFARIKPYLLTNPDFPFHPTLNPYYAPDIEFGETFESGSNLEPVSAIYDLFGRIYTSFTQINVGFTPKENVLTGTWRAMGDYKAEVYQDYGANPSEFEEYRIKGATLWVRIS